MPPETDAVNTSYSPTVRFGVLLAVTVGSESEGLIVMVFDPAFMFSDRSFAKP